MNTKQMPDVASIGHGRHNGSGQPTLQLHGSTASKARQALYAANGRAVAWVQGGALCKQVDGSKHFLRQPAGIAFDAAILTQAEDAGAARVWIRDRETGTVYRATLEAFALHGVRVDRGFGVQVCLPFAFWQRETPGAPRQLSLF